MKCAKPDCQCENIEALKVQQALLDGKCWEKCHWSIELGLFSAWCDVDKVPQDGGITAPPSDPYKIGHWQLGDPDTGYELEYAIVRQWITNCSETWALYCDLLARGIVQ